MKTDLGKILELLEEFFEDNPEKVVTWLNAENPNFGNTSPWVFIHNGLGAKVLHFLKTAMDENKQENDR